ncbi:TPA: hypothetical protein HA246_04900 [Candidatus Woesearchaeota archaeon]|nr:hypothetical protein [Candidatus Woesearchaeota archaeon]
MNHSTNHKKRIFIVLLSLITFLFTINTSTAICCNNACYDTGVCYPDANGAWYQGCRDSDGNVYKPNDQFLGGCMICICQETDHTKCEWKPNDKYCKTSYGPDFMCNDTSVAPNPPNSKSNTCEDRDSQQKLCENIRCSNKPGTWTYSGEADLATLNEKGYSEDQWEYVPGSYSSRTLGCCGDDSSEYYISNLITINGVTTTYSACCDSNLATRCVDSNGICQNEKSKEVSCQDLKDNDCDGLGDWSDPDCCPSPDENSNCCSLKGGTYNENSDSLKEGRCCGDKPEDNGFIGKEASNPQKNRFLCYSVVNPSNNVKTWKWEDLSDSTYLGYMYAIDHPAKGMFDVLKSDTGFYECDATPDIIDQGSVKVANLNEVRSKKRIPDIQNEYICHNTVDKFAFWSGIQGQQVIDRFGECVSPDDNTASNFWGGKQYFDGNKLDGPNKRYCCTEDAATKGWVDDLDIKSCLAKSIVDGKPQLNTYSACEQNNFKPALAGEDNPANPLFAAKNSVTCCGDDFTETGTPFEYYTETTITATKYSACCDKQTDCVDATNTCRNESVGGEKSCNDNIDNDCDGFIDHGTFDNNGNQLTQPDPDCCGDGDLFPTCCQFRGGTWFDDGNGNKFCCGDDTPEYVVNSTITYKTSSSPIGPNKGTYSCCPDRDDCVYDGKCHTSAKDGAKENANNGCYDSKDNDCDLDLQTGASNGVIDFSEVYVDNNDRVPAVADEDRFRTTTRLEDDDCTLTVTGKIVGEGNEADPVGGAHIIMQGSFNSPYLTGGVAKQPKLTYEADTLSADEANGQSQVGTFTIVGVNGDSSYDITVTHPDYEPKIKHVEVEYDDKTLPAIKIGPDHDTCNSDCTNIGNDLCNKECDAEFGSTPHPNCYFGGQVFDQDKRQKIAQLCNQKVSGQLVNYTYEKDPEGNSLFVECCKGSPEPFRPSTATISSGPRQDLIRTTRIITYRGKPVKMIIDSFG